MIHSESKSFKTIITRVTKTRHLIKSWWRETFSRIHVDYEDFECDDHVERLYRKTENFKDEIYRKPLAERIACRRQDGNGSEKWNRRGITERNSCKSTPYKYFITMVENNSIRSEQFELYLYPVIKKYYNTYFHKYFIKCFHHIAL